MDDFDNWWDKASANGTIPGWANNHRAANEAWKACQERCFRVCLEYASRASHPVADLVSRELAQKMKE